ncbi:hypothetical protein MSAN_01225100 [Mycena sanguinolenta]|uniref:Uncharacterized protein n=1 Tax=Mycena sanguinolenta TaxID=230812 RepID=A0A8H6YIE4_9AGAR|nr:hypothetical protein MSAN_01225100 [Mycena sanguinolenta]
MSSFRTHEAIGPHQMALQATRTDHRNARRNAVDFGSPAKKPTQSTPPVTERLIGRQNAFDPAFDPGLPPRQEHPRHHGIPPVVAFGLPPVLFLPAHATSLVEKHPHSYLELTPLGSGNHAGAPINPSNCGGCEVDELIEREYTKRTGRPFPVFPVQYMKPRGSEVDVPFSNMKDAHHRLVSHRVENGIEFTLKIEGYAGVKDIIYLNCGHRQVTRFNLVWLLALLF